MKITKWQYSQAVHMALHLKAQMEGDGMYSKADVNFLALESMVVGWIWAQPWFANYRRAINGKYKRDNVYLVVRDWALQAACDAVNGDPKFNGRAAPTVFDRKIKRAAARVGLVKL